MTGAISFGRFPRLLSPMKRHALTGVLLVGSAISGCETRKAMIKNRQQSQEAIAAARRETALWNKLSQLEDEERERVMTSITSGNPNYRSEFEAIQRLSKIANEARIKSNEASNKADKANQPIFHALLTAALALTAAIRANRARNQRRRNPLSP